MILCTLAGIHNLLCLHVLKVKRWQLIIYQGLDDFCGMSIKSKNKLDANFCCCCFCLPTAATATNVGKNVRKWSMGVDMDRSENQLYGMKEAKTNRSNNNYLRSVQLRSKIVHVRPSPGYSGEKKFAYPMCLGNVYICFCLYSNIICVHNRSKVSDFEPKQSEVLAKSICNVGSFTK